MRTGQAWAMGARGEVDLEMLLSLVIGLVLQAGQLLKRERNRVGGPRGAGYTADVDAEIEAWLRPKLLNLVNGDYLGEETGSEIEGNTYCWAVDPHDGTADFLKGADGSSISVGLLRDGIPVLGVVYAPILDQRDGECIAWAEGLPHVLRNGVPEPFDLSSATLDGSYVMVSAAAILKHSLNTELCAPGQYLPMPSIAYRLARVAAGDGVCAVSLYPVKAYDVVAGHALLRGSGGDLFDQNGEPIRYSVDDQPERSWNRCFGGTPEVCVELSRRDWSRIRPL